MDDKVKDKVKIQEIMNEIANLKRYSNELGNNVRGDKLENYINNFSKNINLLNDEVEKIYQDSFNTID